MTSGSDFHSNSNESEDISSDDVSVKQKVRRQSSSELKYVCPHEGCGQKFKRNTYLDRHEYQTHSKIRKHVCTMEGCDKRYIILTHLTRHIRTFHQKKHEGEPKNRIKCNIATCMRYFNTISNMERHVRQYHENPKIYDCPKCSFTCRHKLQFFRHLETHESGSKKQKPNKKTHSCETCKEIFTKWSELLAHRKKSHPPKCAICERTFTKSSNLRSHLLDHKKKAEKSTLVCPYDECTRSYLQKRNLQAHIQVHHEGKKFKCPVAGCDKVLSSKRRLDCHVELHSKDDIEIVRKEPTERKDKGVKKVSTISILAGTAVRIKCNIDTCMRYFNTLSNMERHVRQYHENPKIYDCPKCSFTCRHKLQFVRHQETHESGSKKQKPNKKTHSCETCKEIFTKWSELLAHRKKLHPLKCAICERTFTKSSNLRSHLLDHKKKTEKSMSVCPNDECTRPYLQESNIQAHIQVHHEEMLIDGRGNDIECNSFITTSDNDGEELRHVPENVRLIPLETE